jgi:hypothetical protein
MTVIKLKTVSLLDVGIKEPGANTYKGFFNSNAGFDISYNVDCQLITVENKLGQTRSFHVSRAKDMEIIDDDPPARPALKSVK